jgi:hypothetical protein
LGPDERHEGDLSAKVKGSHKPVIAASDLETDTLSVRDEK